jgi:hypothetical protein
MSTGGSAWLRLSIAEATVQIDRVLWGLPEDYLDYQQVPVFSFFSASENEVFADSDDESDEADRSRWSLSFFWICWILAFCVLQDDTESVRL